MKIIHFSNTSYVRESTDIINDFIDVHVITQFFVHKNKNRHHEIQECLRKNMNNTSISKIHLINEREYSPNELGLSSAQTTSGKLIQYITGKRLKYNTCAEYVRKSKLHGFIIFTNSDIFFDESVYNLQLTNLHKSKKLFALLRYEYNPAFGYDYGKCPLFCQDNSKEPRFESQDTWIYHTNMGFLEKQEKAMNIEFGKPGCDNKMAYIFTILGYELINDPHFIKTYHYHSTQIRDYTHKDIIPNPWAVIVPTGCNPLAIPPSMGINLAECAKATQYFKDIQFSDNTVIYNYILDKFAGNTTFVIPRISGIENNVAVFARIGKRNGTFSKETMDYFNRVSGAMKNNAGIKMSTLASVVTYSDMYLKAFDQCDLYCGWEPQGNYIHHIAQSHEYMRFMYQAKQCVWSFALDIFHYIYLQPWTQALANKRILIVSPFVASFQEKVEKGWMDKIYDIDLFPGCEFVFIKPPQTQANEQSLEFDVELRGFFSRLDEMRDMYDVALLSCGGYANPVCSYIYENHGKSAIYVGGVLQMYFGVLGARWLKERPDVVRLYLNEFWTRPKIEERPKGCEQVEGGCYW